MRSGSCVTTCTYGWMQLVEEGSVELAGFLLGSLVSHTVRSQ